ncbi:hypothetical protein G6F65_021639 [Rhizopus arrhizus]|nr:hypothetical protein G6F65_021639 [Rhizopus arrhizus]
MGAQVIDDGRKAQRAFVRRGAGHLGVAAEFAQQRVQGAVEGQRFARLPQGVEQGGDALRASAVVDDGRFDPPDRFPG